MNAYSSDFHQPSPPVAGESVAHSEIAASEGINAEVPDSEVWADPIAMRWDALHDAAAAVATLAALPAEKALHAPQDFAAMIAAAPSWKANLMRNSVQDIAAFMQSGLKALLALNPDERDPAAAAYALWNEFEYARDALLALGSDSLR